MPEPIEHLLAVPYVLDVAAVEKPDGDWVCRVAYEELPGCVAEATNPLEALDTLERLRVEITRARLERGLDVPAPRHPLRS